MADSLYDAPLTLDKVALADLTLDPRNARLHGEENLASIQGSLGVFGQREPIVVKRGTNVVIGGNGRVEAMRSLGWTHCSVTYVDCTDAEATALGLALNRTAETAAWDTNQLDDLLAEVQDAGFAAESFGFSTEAVDKLLADAKAAQGQTEQDIEELTEHVPPADSDVEVTDIVPPKDPETKLGDVWLLGEHRLVCGDSADFGTVEKLMDGDKADLVCTDPPYNLAEKNNLITKTIRETAQKLKDATWDAGFNFDDVAGNLLAFAAEDVSCYVFTSHHVVPLIWAWMETWSKYHGFCIWHKTNPMPSMAKRHWTWSTELVAYGTRGKHTFNFPEDGHARNVWDFPGTRDSKFHPTTKPVALIEHVISHSSEPGDIVLDLFGGAGSCLLAAEKLGRRARLSELNPAYCDVIKERWAQLSGGTPKLLNPSDA